MQRRQVVRSVALLAVGAAGCSEAPSPTPAPPSGPPPDTDTDDGDLTTTRQPLLVENDYTWRESSQGTVTIDVTVTNPGPAERVATFRITARLDGETIEQQRRVELGSGESSDLEVTFDFDYDAWDDGSKGLDFSFDYQS